MPGEGSKYRMKKIKVDTNLCLSDDSCQLAHILTVITLISVTLPMRQIDQCKSRSLLTQAVSTIETVRFII